MLLIQNAFLSPEPLISFRVQLRVRTEHSCNSPASGGLMPYHYQLIISLRHSVYILLIIVHLQQKLYNAVDLTTNMN